MTSCSVAGPNPEDQSAEAEQAQLRLLEGPGAAEPLRLALQTLGRRLEDWSLVQVHHRPGAGATGIYETRALAGDGGLTTEFLCISTAALPDRSRATVRLTGSGGPVLNVWQHPNDPLLPGLPWACDASVVGPALFPGVGSSQPDQAPVLTTVSYRPLRRAVLSADLAGERRYLKVLRSGQARQLADRHRLLTAAGIPAPLLIDVPGEDVLAMHPAVGTPLAELLMRDGARSLHPNTLVDLLQRLPAAAMDMTRRPAWAERVRDYAKGAVAVLPSEKARITAVAEQVHQLASSLDPGPKVPTHGDFYEGNLLVTGDRVSGLLDVDALGPGHLVDDLACFIGHLAVLPALDPRYIHVPGALQRFLDIFDDVVNPAGLRCRAAGVALTLVAGAKHRVTSGDEESWQSDAQQRLSIAEGLIGDAAALNK